MDELGRSRTRHGLARDRGRGAGDRLDLPGPAARGRSASSAALSFHETKNVICGEGGALLRQRRPRMSSAPRSCSEKGTDRAPVLPRRGRQVHVGRRRLVVPAQRGRRGVPLGAARARGRDHARAAARSGTRYHAAFAALEADGLAAPAGRPGRTARTTRTCTTCCCRDLESATRMIAALARRGIAASSTTCRCTRRRRAGASAAPTATSPNTMAAERAAAPAAALGRHGADGDRAGGRRRRASGAHRASAGSCASQVTAAGASARVSVVVPVYNSAGTLGDARRPNRRGARRASTTKSCSSTTAAATRAGSRSARSSRRARACAGLDLDAQLRAAQRPARGHSRGRRRGHRHAGRRPAEPAGGDPAAARASSSEGFDVVYGTPNARSTRCWRNLAARVVRLACAARWGTSPARSSAFRAFRTELRDAFASFAGPYVSIDVLLSWATSRSRSVEVEHHASGARVQSTYSFGKLASLALTMLTGFRRGRCGSRACSGSTCTFFGVVVLVYVVCPLGRRGKHRLRGSRSSPR